MQPAFFLDFTKLGRALSSPAAGQLANEQVSAFLMRLSTIRARAGLPVLADRALIFVTGGLAKRRWGLSSSGMVDVHTQLHPE